MYIIGNPYFDNMYEVKSFYKDIILNKNNHNFLSKINSEFLIIIINTKSMEIEVINSRFSSPVVFYSLTNNTFTISNNLLINLMKRKNNDFKIDHFAAWHFLKYRRIFGNRTLDVNTKFLESSSILKFKNFKVYRETYFHPSYKKNNNNLSENANLLNLNLKKNLEALSFGKHKLALALSGGTDTRLLLSNIKKDIDCYNYTYLKNRESLAAEKVCKELNKKFYWKKIPENIYIKTINRSSLVNSSMYMADGIHYTNEESFKNYEIVFSGYGLDFLFQGMYLPTKNYKFLSKPLYIKHLKKIKNNVINFFIENISYKAKGFPIDQLIDSGKISNYKNEIKLQLIKKYELINNLTDNIYDQFEYLSLSDVSRHYTYGGQLALGEVSNHLIPAYSNELLELSQSIPEFQKIDGKISKEAIKQNNPRLVEIINANHGFKMKYNSLQLTFFSGIKKIINPTRGKFHRTWKNMETVIRNELHEKVLDLQKTGNIYDLDFIDKSKLNLFLEDWKSNRVLGNHTLLLLITLNEFLNSVKKLK
tara:strand:+ start:552 stop:2156 length:1605 start_codon:yes stop_codon:yes gene_type:complete